MITEISTNQELINILFVVFACYTSMSLIKRGLKIRMEKKIFQRRMKKYQVKESMFRECPKAKKQQEEEK